jgi:hypothetical protein
MATLHIQCTNTPAANTVVEVFQRGTNGQPDTLVQSGLITTGAGSTEVALPAGCYAVVREATEGEAKSIDNW